ncbi:hypothetical protein F1643_06035 [Azospirillum sp. INR13]|nr:hypothetical protein [Azospirillum sp. INR13]
MSYEQFVITAVPVVVLVAYVLIARFTRSYRLREDRIGDNAYYLGFLYTLTSLAMSLWQFGSRDADTRGIITNFGIALATTIAGVAARVILSQMRQDPVEVEREARMALSDAVSRLKGQLDNSVVDLNSFRRSTQQSLQEGMDEMAEKVNALLTEHAKKLEETTDSLAADLKKTLGDFSGEAASLNKAVGKTVAAVGRLADRVDAIRSPEDLLEQKIEPATQGIARIVETAERRVAGQAGQVEQLNAALASMVESAKRLELGMGAMDASRRDQIGETKAMLADLRGAVGEVSDAIRSAAKREAAAATEVERLAAAAATLAAATAEMAKTTADAKNRQDMLAESATDAVVRSASAVDSFRGAIEQQVAAARRATDGMEELRRQRERQIAEEKLDAAASAEAKQMAAAAGALAAATVELAKTMDVANTRQEMLAVTAADVVKKSVSAVDRLREAIEQQIAATQSTSNRVDELLRHIERQATEDPRTFGSRFWRL